MELTDSQEKQIKDQLREQVKDMPEVQRKQAEQQIDAMTKDQLIQLIKKNQEESGIKEDECIFCAIVNDKTHSIKIDENDEAIAIMDINPIAKGHVLVIPKDHDKEPTQKSQELAFAVGGRILQSLKPKDITTRAAKIMEHTILNVIPIYDNTDLEKRIKMTEEELVKTAQAISEIEQPKKVEKIKEAPQVSPIESKGSDVAAVKGKSSSELSSDSEERSGSNAKPTKEKKELPKVPPRIP